MLDMQFMPIILFKWTAQWTKIWKIKKFIEILFKPYFWDYIQYLLDQRIRMENKLVKSKPSYKYLQVLNWAFAEPIKGVSLKNHWGICTPKNLNNWIKSNQALQKMYYYLPKELRRFLDQYQHPLVNWLNMI